MAKIAVGTIKRVDGTDATDSQCTTSTLYVDLPGTSETFTLGGSASDEVVVMFQAEWISNVGRPIIRLVIDGVVQTGPGDAASPFAPWEGTAVGTSGFTFISDPLAFTRPRSSSRRCSATASAWTSAA